MGVPRPVDGRCPVRGWVLPLNGSGGSVICRTSNVQSSAGQATYRRQSSNRRRRTGGDSAAPCACRAWRTLTCSNTFAPRRSAAPTVHHGARPPPDPLDRVAAPAAGHRPHAELGHQRTGVPPGGRQRPQSGRRVPVAGSRPYAPYGTFGIVAWSTGDGLLGQPSTCRCPA
jgi:hypothetical protein